MLLSKLLVLLMTLLPAEEGRWQRITTDQHISFIFPNTPQKLTQNSGKFISHVYQTKDLACAFGIVCTDFSQANIQITKENARQLYEELKKGSLQMETAKLKSERTIPYSDMLIKEIEYSIIKDNYEMTYFKRFIFRDNYVYQISIGGRTRHRDVIEEERDLFFNSITFDHTQNNPGNDTRAFPEK